MLAAGTFVLRLPEGLRKRIRGGARLAQQGDKDLTLGIF